MLWIKKFFYFSVLVIALVLFSSHDMYLKLDQYFIAPFSKTTVQLFNETYERSENVIDRDRMIDVSVVLNGQRIHPSENSWFERDSITFLNLETKENVVSIAETGVDFVSMGSVIYDAKVLDMSLKAL